VTKADIVDKVAESAGITKNESTVREEIEMAKKTEAVKSETGKKQPIKDKAPVKKEASTKKKEVSTKVKTSAAKTQFEFLAPEAGEVYLAGDFNNWDPQSTPLKKDKKGIWKISLPLKPGRYEYRYFIDDNWVSICLAPPAYRTISVLRIALSLLNRNYCS